MPQGSCSGSPAALAATAAPAPVAAAARAAAALDAATMRLPAEVAPHRMHAAQLAAPAGWAAGPT